MHSIIKLMLESAHSWVVDFKPCRHLFNVKCPAVWVLRHDQRLSFYINIGTSVKDIAKMKPKVIQLINDFKLTWAIVIGKCPSCVVRRAASTICFKWQLLLYPWANWLEVGSIGATCRSKVAKTSFRFKIKNRRPGRHLKIVFELLLNRKANWLETW